MRRYLVPLLVLLLTASGVIAGTMPPNPFLNMAGGGGGVTGGSCTNQSVSAIDTAGAPTCSSTTESWFSFTDVTTANASTSKHGLLPKLDGNSAHFLDGTGGWTTPTGFSAAGSGSELQARSSATTVQAVTGSSTANGGIALVNQSAAAVPLKVTGAASQSGDYFDIGRSGGSAGDVFAVQAVASGVNGFAFVPSATGANVQLATTGPDSTVGFTLLPKGNGTVLFNSTERLQIGGISNHFMALRASTDSTNGYPLAIEAADDSVIGYVKINGLALQTGSFNNATADASIRAGNTPTFVMRSAGVIGFASGSTGNLNDNPDAAWSRCAAGTLCGGTGSQGSTAATLQVQRVQLTTATQGACDSSHAGQLQYTAGGVGVKDVVTVCAKDAADAYAWRTVY